MRRQGAFPGNFSFGGDVVSAEEYDPEGAMEVLEEAGWRDEDGDGVREKDGTPLVLRWLTYPSRQELPVLAESAQATLGEIGFQVEIINTSDHNRVRMDSGAWDIYVSAFVTAPTETRNIFSLTGVWMNRMEIMVIITVTVWRSWHGNWQGHLIFREGESWRWKCSRPFLMIMRLFSAPICVWESYPKPALPG